MSDLVSVVIPCLNGAGVIERCLDSILANDYPNDQIEVLLVDGMSADGTRDIVRAYSEKYPCIHILDNPLKTQQIALNIGIRKSKGQFILRLDAHAMLEPTHISRCVDFLKISDADNVGGRLITRPRHNTIIGKAIAVALSEWFGVGGSLFRLERAIARPQRVKTVPYSCYRRSVFDRCGLFDERLDRSEDAEFHQRMYKAGCKTFLIPDLVSHYRARSDLRSFMAHSFDNGLWSVLPTKFTGGLVVSLRHMVPLVFVSLLLGLILTIPFLNGAHHVLLFILGSYLSISAGISGSIALRRRNLSLLPTLPLIFSVLHIGYGLGSLWGVARVCASRLVSRDMESDPVIPLLYSDVPDPLPFVSIVIPCRNEEECLQDCLTSIVEGDYPHDRLELIIVDGMSDDRTREILRTYVHQYPFIRLFDNPAREQQLALNIGIGKARGDIIVRMDAHSLYLPNYVSECVRALYMYGADVVGGRWIVRPREQSLIGNAICFATSVTFGVGNAFYRLSSLQKPNSPYLNSPRWGINAAYLSCRREVFDHVGLFNERLDRSEDIDFRRRVQQAGLRSLFVPSIVTHYLMRVRLGTFLRHTFKNGLWVVLPLDYAAGVSFSFRHIMPLIFVLIIALCTYLATMYEVFQAILLTFIGAYTCLNLYYSVRVAFREREEKYLFILPWIFLLHHLVYGMGSLVGLVRIGWRRTIGRIALRCRPRVLRVQGGDGK